MIHEVFFFSFVFIFQWLSKYQNFRKISKNCDVIEKMLTFCKKYFLKKCFSYDFLPSSFWVFVL